jgi:hypothetical protein
MNGEVYLNVQDLQTQKCYNLSWNMEYSMTVIYGFGV